MNIGIKAGQILEENYWNRWIQFYNHYNNYNVVFNSKVLPISFNNTTRDIEISFYINSWQDITVVAFSTYPDGGSETGGYAVIKSARTVADLVAGDEVSGALLEHAVNRLNEENINIILGLAVKGNRVEDDYSRLGFVDSRERVEVFVSPVAGSRVNETVLGFKPERMMYCWGDHDSLPTSLPSN